MNLPLLLVALLIGLPFVAQAQITIESGAALTVQSGATLTAEGAVTNAGTISGQGTLHVAGDFSTTGNLAINIGPDPATHPTIAVTGAATLAGTFTVTNEAYIPASGDRATIITSGGNLGTSFTNAVSNTWFAQYNFPVSGDFTLAYGSGLPVELIRFSASRRFTAVLLDWETATESNNAGFAIQHSTTGTVWATIGFVNGAGTSRTPIRYTYRDESPAPRMNYYRLRQVDHDGTFAYSKIVAVAMERGSPFALYPNPAYRTLQVSGIDRGEVVITDLFGRTMLHTELTGSGIPIEALPAGTYFLKISSGNLVLTERFVKGGG